MNILMDEMRPSPEIWSVAPRQVSVALQNACDLTCSYCYAPKAAARLDAETVVSWLAELDRHGCLGVGFGGGEPTLFRQFASLCRTVTAETGLAVSFTTHGHRLDKALCSALVGNVHFVRISMDGVEGTYERLRGRSFAKLIEALQKVRAIAPFGINYVVNEETLPDLDAALDIAHDEGAAEFLLLPEQPVAGKGGIREATARELAAWVDKYAGRVPLAVSTVGGDSLPTCSPTPSERPLDAYAHIDARSTLKRSSFDSEGERIGTYGVLHALRRLRERDGLLS
ncbi:MAG: radical SAM protein [Catenulispora sp.]